MIFQMDLILFILCTFEPRHLLSLFTKVHCECQSSALTMSTHQQLHAAHAFFPR